MYLCMYNDGEPLEKKPLSWISKRMLMIFFFLFLQVRERELLICYSTKRVGKRRRRRASLGRVWEEFDLRSCSAASAHAWDQLHITMMKSHSFSKWGRENVPHYDAIIRRTVSMLKGIYDKRQIGSWIWKGQGLQIFIL